MAERDELEEQANRLDLVSRWADDLAHEIKNPLHAMVINLELVKRRAGDAEPGPLIERAQVVESELHRVHALVDSLLKLVRPWPDTYTATVQQVFEALFPVFQARARIRKLEYEHQAGSAIVAMAPGALAQVLVNLVDNAIDATPEGGRITTAIRKGNDASATITVTDGGPGVSWGADATGDPPGVRPGLGLAVSRRLLKRAGGSLALAPLADGGTGATVSIPVTGSV